MLSRNAIVKTGGGVAGFRAKMPNFVNDFTTTTHNH